MTSICRKGLRRGAVVLLALALAAPLLSGCSTLGIATSEELSATESRLENSSRATNSRLDNLEKGTADLQQTLAQITSSIDSLNTGFARAKKWLETMNLDTISADAQAASNAAVSAEARSRAFLKHYLEWIKQQHALLEKQIATLEAQMKEATEGTSKSPDSTEGNSSEKPPDSEGGDGSSNDED
jgi:chromosome segregation ATPase